MTVLHLAPLWFPTALNASGGRETVLASLAGAQEQLGCNTILVGPGDSQPPGRLVAVTPRNLYDMMGDKEAHEATYYEQHQLLLALENTAQADIIHSHAGWYAYVLSGVPALRGRVLHTHHTPVWPDLEWFVRQHSDFWFTTVSEFQARWFWKNGARRCRVIHNGIQVSSFEFHPAGGDGLVFIGRIERSKGPDLAVQAAMSLNRPLTLAGPIIDGDYFKSSIQPHLSDRIRYVGVVGHAEKNKLLGEAGCAVLPFRGQEGFPMVNIESFACGTPVVSLANGPMPEIIENGLTGYLATEESGLTRLIEPALRLERAAIRRRVASRWDIAIIAQAYVNLYREILSNAP